MPDARRPNRMLFINQGQATRRAALGMLRAHQVLQAHVRPLPWGTARFRVMKPFNLLQRALVTPIPGLPGHGYSDLRWFITQSLTARRIIREEIRSWDPTVVHVTVDGAALLLPALQTELPCVPAFDTTMSEWMQMCINSPSGDRPCTPWRVLREGPKGIRCGQHPWSSRGASTSAMSCTPWRQRRASRLCIPVSICAPSRRPPAPGGRVYARILFVGGRFEAKGGPALLLSLPVARLATGRGSCRNHRSGAASPADDPSSRGTWNPGLGPLVSRR